MKNTRENDNLQYNTFSDSLQFPSFPFKGTDSLASIAAMINASFVPAEEHLLPSRRRPSIVLVGLMGAGKSSIGKALSQRLQLPFVDSDAVIEARSGRSIGEIFDIFGEAWFREREHETIRDLLAGEAMVLGSGGGAFLDARTRACVRQYGVSIWLRADLNILAERLAKRMEKRSASKRRPLLRDGDPLGVLQQLLQERESTYASADIITESRSIPKHDVVENILEALETLTVEQRAHPFPKSRSLVAGAAAGGADAPERVHVALGNRSYDIFIGEGLLTRLGEFLLPLFAGGRRARVCVVADETVAALHLDALQEALRRADIAADVLCVPSGEASKSFPRLQWLVERLLESGIERGDLVLAFGGGMAGDLAGCAAGLALRGVGFVQIPTSLLAQVDSSIGGKTGINVARGKNLVGLFHQPSLVIADTSLLASLPRRQLASGYAEVVKYALIQDAPLFSWLEKSGGDILAGDPQALRRAVWASCRAKAAIVAADERESGQRALLNLGHSFGHALEHAAGYDERLLHGEAVAIGMNLAFGFSCRLGLCPREDVERVRAHLRSMGLPTELGGLDFVPDSDSLLGIMLRDKKTKGGQLSLILARGIGNCFRADKVDGSALREFLEQARSHTDGTGRGS